MKKAILIGLGAVILSSGSLLAHPPPGDALSQGLWWLYHAQYGKAEELFEQYCQAHPADPAGYFYKAASNWWELAQNLDVKLPDVERRFETHYQKTVEVAKALYESTSDKKKKAKASLYWGGAEGLKGRWLVTQKEWVSAYFLGKNGNRLLRQSVALDPTLEDAYMGLGIYDYFTDTLPGVQGVLAYLFIHGDKKRGLEELNRAIAKSEHARVEAMMFLIEIYTSEENTPEKALPLAQALRKEFPHSYVMHLAEATVLYQMKKWPEMVREAQSLLAHSQNAVPYYSSEGVRPARYLLGLGALYGRHDLTLALAYMNQLLQNVDDSRWVSYAYLRRGQIYDVRGERDKALQDYRAVLARPDFWGSHREANQYLKGSFKFP